VSGHNRSPDVKGRAQPGFNMFHTSFCSHLSYLALPALALDKHPRFRLSYLVPSNDQGQTIPDTARSHSLRSADGIDHCQLVLDDSFRTSRAFLLRNSKLSRLGRWIKAHSRFVQALNEAHRALKILLTSSKPRLDISSAEPSATKFDMGARAEELGTDNLVYIVPTSPMWNDAWLVTEG